MVIRDGAAGTPEGIAAGPHAAGGQNGVARGGPYGMAVGLTAVALWLRLLTVPFLGVRAPYVIFYPVVLASSWFGGLGPGILSTLLSSIAVGYFFLPREALSIKEPADAASLLIFAATGFCIAWMIGQARNAQRDRQAAARDTARADLDSRLRASDARWHAIVDSAVDGIIVIDSSGRIESFNRAAERLFGYSENDVLGHNVSLLMPAPYRDEHDGYIQRYMATGEARIIGKGREVTGRRKDGVLFPLRLSVGEVKLGGEPKFTGIVHDLSSRVAMEEQLREQASLVRLGEMAAVIAHEVKNPLAAIRGAIQVIAQRAPSTGPDAAVMHEIVSRIDSLDGLMKELLLFARPPIARPSPTDIVTLLETTAGLFTRDPALHDVHVEVTGSAPPVPVDPHMLQIVFQNLLLNGAQSMAGRGRIEAAVSVDGSRCEIDVTDHGPGIPAEIRDRVFTPFFTTKARGSGLGLPTAKRLIEAHGGDISVECPPSGGTTVRIRLPLESRPAPPSSAPAS